MNEPITMTGKYRYRNGEPARVLCVDAPRARKVISIDTMGTVHFSNSYGKFNDDGFPHEYDLIPDVPLWEGEIWLNPDKDRNDLFLSEPTDTATWETSMTQLGYRKIKVREVDQCQS